MTPIERHDAMCALRHRDPVLALLCTIEAMGSRKIHNDVCDSSRLTMCGEAAATAIQVITGDRVNPIYGDLDHRHPDALRRTAAEILDLLSFNMNGTSDAHMTMVMDRVSKLAAEATSWIKGTSHAS